MEMPPKKHMFGAVFDVNPVDKTGHVDLEKIAHVTEELDLRPKSKPRKISTSFARNEAYQHTDLALKQLPRSSPAQLPEPSRNLTAREILLQELEDTLAETDSEDGSAVVVDVGGYSLSPDFQKPAPRHRASHKPRDFSMPKSPRLAQVEAVMRQRTMRERDAVRPDVKTRPYTAPGTQAPSRDLNRVFRNEAESQLAASPPQPDDSPIEAEASLAIPVVAPSVQDIQPIMAPDGGSMNFADARPTQKPIAMVSRRNPRSGTSTFLKKWLLSIVMFMGVVAFVVWLSYSRGVDVKNNVVQNGSNAFANFEGAKAELQSMHFAEAADRFALAYDDLHKASGTLSTIGASFLSAFGKLPILNRLSAANNLTLAGESLSKAGENLALAFNTLSTTNLFSYLDSSQSTAEKKSLAKLAKEFKEVLLFADTHMKRADSLLADIDTAAMPDDKKDLLAKFKERTPEFNTLIGDAIAYTDFLLSLVGEKGSHTYMLLFQNNGELRATGGFPGSYGLVTFTDGALSKIFIDDIYNPDGQLKENIIPPVPLQHITPTWGMRDVNWFPDFPTSARKIEAYYKKDGGSDVEGVITITPDIILKLLRIVGPIEMPEYNTTVTADNFLSEMQAEIEYGANRTQPKTILKEFEPRLLAKIHDLDKSRWIDIAHIFVAGIEEKQILAYFNDSHLQEFAREHHLSGETAQTAGDYLRVVYTNIKGSKADVYTDNSLDLTTIVSADSIKHMLKISRLHRGGDQKEGFYNRPNPAYVRVYAPLGSRLDRIDGQTVTDFKPLVNYNQGGFTGDPDLEAIEAGITNPFPGVDAFEESGKTVFGFWLVVQPKENQSVLLSYSVPYTDLFANSYSLLWQKQPGTKSDPIHNNISLPAGRKLAAPVPGATILGNRLILDSDLSTDREIKLTFE